MAVVCHHVLLQNNILLCAFMFFSIYCSNFPCLAHFTTKILSNIGYLWYGQLLNDITSSDVGYIDPYQFITQKIIQT